MENCLVLPFTHNNTGTNTVDSLLLFLNNTLLNVVAQNVFCIDIGILKNVFTARDIVYIFLRCILEQCLVNTYKYFRQVLSICNCFIICNKHFYQYDCSHLIRTNFNVSIIYFSCKYILLQLS